MEKDSKAKVIVESFFRDSSKLGEWHEERLKICNGCPHSSKNLKSPTIVQKALHALNQSQCSACSCVIEKKVTDEREMCGAVEIGEQPRWNAISVQTKSDKHFNLFNHSKDVINVDIDNNDFVLKLGAVPAGTYEFTVELTAKFDYECVAIQVSCGCTTTSFEQEGRSSLIKGGVKLYNDSAKEVFMTLKFDKNGKIEFQKFKITANKS